MSDFVPPVGGVDAYNKAKQWKISVTAACDRLTRMGYSYWGTSPQTGGEIYIPPRKGGNERRKKK